MSKIFLGFLFGFFSVFPIFPSLVRSADDFHTRIQISYEFNPDGSSRVTQEYSLTNLTSQTGAAAYQFDILDKTPENLSAYDSHGKISLKLVSQQSGLTRVLIPFNQLSAGKGKTYNFFLTYTGPQISKVDGLWKITLPNTASMEPGQETIIKLVVPESFGQPLTLYPTTSSVIKTAGRLYYTFPSSSAQLPGIYAIFGDQSLVGFKLRYPKPVSNVSLEIPRDKPGQLVFIQNIDPRPENIQISPEGNWTMNYSKAVDESVITGYLLLDASSSASFPQTGNLSITNLTALPEAVPSIPQISWLKPFQILPFFSFPSRITITNPGSQAIYHLLVSISSPKLIVNSDNDFRIPVIPPLGKIDIPLKLYSPYIPVSSSLQLYVSAGDTVVTYNMDAVYLLLWYGIVSSVIIIVFVILGFLTFRAWSLYFQKSLRSGPLRR